MSGIALAICHRLCGLSTYGFSGLNDLTAKWYLPTLLWSVDMAAFDFE